MTMKSSQLFASFFAALVMLVMATSAQSAVVISFTEQGGDVVASMSGTLNLTDLTSPGTGGQPGFVRPDAGFLMLAGSSGSFTTYQGGIQTPPNSGVFGTGAATLSSSHSGDILGIVSAGTPSLRVPTGYTSGSSLSGTSIWTGATLSSLGITPGSYVWSWGSGANVDTATITAAAVPEPMTWALLGTTAACGGLGAWLRRRRQAA